MFTEKRWSTVGKILTLLGTVAGIIVAIFIIYDRFTKDYDIKAYGDYSAYSLPISIYEELDEFKSCDYSEKDFSELEEFNTIIKDIYVKSNKSSTNDHEEIKKSEIISIHAELYKHFCKEITSENPLKQLYDLMAYSKIYRFYIVNEGTKEVSDLILQLPFNGIYKITDDVGIISPKIHYLRSRLKDRIENSSDVKTTYFEYQIKIGSLRPSNKISILVWTNGSPFQDFLNEEIRVTYPEGVVKVQFPTKVSGFLAWLDEYKSLIFPFSLLLVALILIIYTIFRPRNSN